MRININELKGTFKMCPASTKYHGAYKGGLLAHSKKVFEIYWHLLGFYGSPLSRESALKVSILHDLCKIDNYIENEDGSFSYNKKAVKGHALKSIALAKKLFGLTRLEEKIIKFHMGVYGTYEHNENNPYGNGEYSEAELKAAFEFKEIKAFHEADMIASQVFKC